MGRTRPIVILTALFAAAAFTAGFVAAEDRTMSHDMMHRLMHGDGADHAAPAMAMEDSRSELKLPAPMKVMQRAMMRRHMGTVADIAAALASGDLDKAASLSKSELGWNEGEEERCRMVGEKSGEKGFLDYGMAMHKKADELSAAAKAGEKEKAAAKLAELIRACNACHEKFRL